MPVVMEVEEEVVVKVVQEVKVDLEAKETMIWKRVDMAVREEMEVKEEAVEVEVEE